MAASGGVNVHRLRADGKRGRQIPHAMISLVAFSRQPCAGTTHTSRRWENNCHFRGDYNNRCAYAPPPIHPSVDPCDPPSPLVLHPARFDAVADLGKTLCILSLDAYGAARAKMWNRIMHSINGNRNPMPPRRASVKKKGTDKGVRVHMAAPRGRSRTKRSEAPLVKREVKREAKREVKKEERKRGSAKDAFGEAGAGIGANIGRMLGGAFHAYATSFLGGGDYDVVDTGVVGNSLTAKDSTPTMSEMGDGASRVRFHSWVGKFAITSEFVLHRFSLDPTSDFFLWIKDMAVLYQQWILRGCVILIKSTSNVFSNEGGVGTVTCTVQYDTNGLPYINKEEMMNSLFATTAKVTENQVVAVECAPAQTIWPLKVKQFGVIAEDQQLYSLGTINIATEGATIPRDNAFEVTVLYDIELLKPCLPRPYGQLMLMLDCYPISSPIDPIPDTDDVKQPRINTLMCEVDGTAGTVTLPPDLPVGTIVHVEYVNKVTGTNVGFLNVVGNAYVELVNVYQNQSASLARSVSSITNTGATYAMLSFSLRITALTDATHRASFTLSISGDSGAYNSGTLMVTLADRATASGLTHPSARTATREDFLLYLEEVLDLGPPGLSKFRYTEKRLVDYVDAFRRTPTLFMDQVITSASQYDVGFEEALRTIRGYVPKKRVAAAASTPSPKSLGYKPSSFVYPTEDDYVHFRWSMHESKESGLFYEDGDTEGSTEPVTEFDFLYRREVRARCARGELIPVEQYEIVYNSICGTKPGAQTGHQRPGAPDSFVTVRAERNPTVRSTINGQQGSFKGSCDVDDTFYVDSDEDTEPEIWNKSPVELARDTAFMYEALSPTLRDCPEFKWDGKLRSLRYRVVKFNPVGITVSEAFTEQAEKERCYVWKNPSSQVHQIKPDVFFCRRLPCIIENGLKQREPKGVWTVDKIRKVQCYAMTGRICNHEALRACPGFLVYLCDTLRMFVEKAVLNPEVISQINGDQGEVTGKDDVILPCSNGSLCTATSHQHRLKHDALKGGARRVLEKDSLDKAKKGKKKSEEKHEFYTCEYSLDDCKYQHHYHTNPREARVPLQAQKEADARSKRTEKRKKAGKEPVVVNPERFDNNPDWELEAFVDKDEAKVTNRKAPTNVETVTAVKSENTGVGEGEVKVANSKAPAKAETAAVIKPKNEKTVERSKRAKIGPGAVARAPIGNLEVKVDPQPSATPLEERPSAELWPAGLSFTDDSGYTILDGWGIGPRLGARCAHHGCLHEHPCVDHGAEGFPSFCLSHRINAIAMDEAIFGLVKWHELARRSRLAFEFVEASGPVCQPLEVFCSELGCSEIHPCPTHLPENHLHAKWTLLREGKFEKEDKEYDPSDFKYVSSDDDVSEEDVSDGKEEKEISREPSIVEPAPRLRDRSPSPGVVAGGHSEVQRSRSPSRSVQHSHRRSRPASRSDHRAEESELAPLLRDGPEPFDQDAHDREVDAADLLARLPRRLRQALVAACLRCRDVKEGLTPDLIRGFAAFSDAAARADRKWKTAAEEADAYFATLSKTVVDEISGACTEFVNKHPILLPADPNVDQQLERKANWREGCFGALLFIKLNRPPDTAFLEKLKRVYLTLNPVYKNAHSLAVNAEDAIEGVISEGFAAMSSTLQQHAYVGTDEPVQIVRTREFFTSLGVDYFDSVMDIEVDRGLFRFYMFDPACAKLRQRDAGITDSEGKFIYSTLMLPATKQAFDDYPDRARLLTPDNVRLLANTQSFFCQQRFFLALIAKASNPAGIGGPTFQLRASRKVSRLGALRLG